MGQVRPASEVWRRQAERSLFVKMTTTTECCYRASIDKCQFGVKHQTFK